MAETAAAAMRPARRAAAAGHPSPRIAAQFDDPDQQREAGRLGMWIFLATEVLFFGVMFAAYAWTRLRFPDAFGAGSRLTDVVLGSINTAVLLTSSFTMALAVHATGEGNRRLAVLALAATALLGAAFLGIKGLEYVHDFREHLVPLVDFRASGVTDIARRGVELFFCFYFAMTAIHAIHLAIGIGIVGTLIAMTLRGKVGRSRAAPVELSGLYWHLVDIVWIFLYPLLYLVSRA